MTLTIAFTGHRPDKLYGYNMHDIRYRELRRKIRSKLSGLIEEFSPDEILIVQGMAIGTDQLAAEIAFEMRKENSRIKVEAAIPCLYQYTKWSPELREKFHEIEKNCDIVTMVSDQKYTPACMHVRNEYMVDKADVVIAVWNGDSHGGTAGAVRYARQKRKRIEIIEP